MSESDKKETSSVVEKKYTEEEFNERLRKELDAKMDLIEHELKKRSEAKLIVREKELEDKINALNKEVYGAKALRYFADLNGDLQKFDDFVKANDIDITKPEKELKKEMESIMEKKTFYRDLEKPNVFYGPDGQKDAEEDFLEDAIKAYKKPQE